MLLKPSHKKKKILFCYILDLSPPIDGLKFTRLWLQEVYQNITTESSAQDMSTAVIMRKAYIKILEWKTTENFPEV